MIDFITAAFPWVLTGVLLAVFAAFNRQIRASRPICLCFGLFFGLVAAWTLGISVTIGMLIGFAAALLIPAGGRAEEQEN